MLITKLFLGLLQRTGKGRVGKKRKRKGRNGEEKEKGSGRAQKS